MQGPYAFKIGITNNIKRRLRAFNHSIPFDVKLKFYAKFPDRESAAVAETIVKKHFANDNLRGEWFLFRDHKLGICINKTYSRLTLVNDVIRYIRNHYKYICIETYEIKGDDLVGEIRKFGPYTWFIDGYAIYG